MISGEDIASISGSGIGNIQSGAATVNPSPKAGAADSKEKNQDIAMMTNRLSIVRKNNVKK